MLPILQREVVEKKKWATEEELTDYYAIGQCTPGVIAVNVATFIGQKNKGILGGIIATLGVVFPSIVIISIIAAFISNFSELEIVKHAFSGLRICVCALVLNAIVKLGKKSIVDAISFTLFIVVVCASFIFDISPIISILFAAICGIVYKVVLGGNK